MNCDLKAYNVFKISELILCDIYVRRKNFTSNINFKIGNYITLFLRNKEIKLRGCGVGGMLFTSTDYL